MQDLRYSNCVGLCISKMTNFNNWALLVVSAIIFLTLVRFTVKTQIYNNFPPPNLEVYRVTKQNLVDVLVNICRGQVYFEPLRHVHIISTHHRLILFLKQSAQWFCYTGSEECVSKYTFNPVSVWQTLKWFGHD